MDLKPSLFLHVDRFGSSTHPPELVIHCGHPEAEHFHQLALALVALVGPGEPGQNVRKPRGFWGLKR